MERPKKISKVLSSNDLGLTGSHQAGMLIPKDGPILHFFPPLDGNHKNPRTVIDFMDETGNRWSFTFIYYNNKITEPNGTRNEYRLTCMTKYLRESNLKPGDSIIMERSDTDYYIYYERMAKSIAENLDNQVKLSLSNSWKVVEL